MARRSIALPFSLVLLASTSACGDAGAEVVIDTRLGDDRAQSELERARAVIEGLAEAGTTWWAQRGATAPAVSASADGDPPPAPSNDLDYVPVPPHTSEAFTAQIAALREGPIDEVGILTRNLAEAGPNLWPEIAELLLAARERPKAEYKHVLDVIGGDVPNRYGHFDRTWKKAHGYDVRLSTDWFEDLLGVAPGRISSSLRPVYRDALLTVALLRAAAKIARESHGERERVGEIVSVLLDAAYVHDGTFRDEVGRAIDAIGNAAIPHLLRESVVPERAEDGSVPERRAAYASYCLDRMDRLHPSRAIEAVSDDRLLLADTLSAYGLVRGAEAAPLLLARLDTDAPGVRRAAREAFEAYVVGPTPQVRRKSIRLLGGATSSRRAELSYREQARLSLREQLAKTAPELLEPECELWLPSGVIDPECERQPERLYRAYVAHLDQQRALRRDALVTRALTYGDRLAGAAMLDTLLTDTSAPVQPDLIAPFYAEVATQLEQAGQTEQAAALLRKSAMLLADADPVRSRELTVDALVLEAKTEGLDERGRMMLLYTARDLDSDGTAVEVAFGQLEAAIESSSAAARGRWLWWSAGVLAALAMLLWLGAWLHRPRDAESA